MRCPFCGKEDTKVIDSRLLDDNSIRRRRLCEKCNKRFTTYERLEQPEIIVVKKNNTVETYDKSKIKKGILQACTKRPVSVEEIDRIVNEVETEIFANNEKKVRSIDIGELILQKLKALDQVAYIRFASVYRNFKEVDNFGEELENIKKK